MPTPVCSFNAWNSSAELMSTKLFWKEEGSNVEYGFVFREMNRMVSTLRTLSPAKVRTPTRVVLPQIIHCQERWLTCQVYLFLPNRESSSTATTLLFGSCCWVSNIYVLNMDCGSGMGSTLVPDLVNKVWETVSRCDELCLIFIWEAIKWVIPKFG